MRELRVCFKLNPNMYTVYVLHEEHGWMTKVFSRDNGIGWMMQQAVTELFDLPGQGWKKKNPPLT